MIARQSRATVTHETGTSAARRIPVLVWYDAPLHRSSAIPGVSVGSFCHFRGTIGAWALMASGNRWFV